MEHARQRLYELEQSTPDQLPVIPPLPVEHVQQPDSYSCGAAALAMVLRFYGVAADVTQLRSELHVVMYDGPLGGTQEADLVSVAKQHGVKLNEREDAQLQDVVDALQAGRPVLLGYIHTGEADYRFGHFTVIIGTTAQSFISHDPWYGPHQDLDAGYLDQNWTAESGQAHRWMLS